MSSDGPVPRAVAWPPGRHGLLNLPARLAAGPVEPLLLGGWIGHPAELAHRREAELARGQRAIEPRQLGQGPAHPEPLLGLPSRQPDQAPRVLAQAGVAGAGGHAETLGGQQPATQLALVDSTFGTQLDQTRVHPAPVRDGLGLVSRRR